MIKKHIALLIFVILYISLSLATYKDFGITWDESVNYNRGVLSYQLIFKKIVKKPFKFNKKNGWLDIKEAPSTFSSFKRYLNIKKGRFRDY